MTSEPADNPLPDNAKIEAAGEALQQAMRQIQHTFGLKDSEIAGLIGVVAMRAIFNEPPEPLPTVAPEMWASRDLNLRENAPTFTRRVYGKWLEHGIARKDIARLDSDLYKALSVWLARHPDDEIAKQLPSQSEEIDRAIKHLSAQYPVEFLRKLGYAIDTRLRRQQK